VDQLIDNGNHAVLLKEPCENLFYRTCILVLQSYVCVFIILIDLY